MEIPACIEAVAHPVLGRKQVPSANTIPRQLIGSQGKVMSGASAPKVAKNWTVVQHLSATVWPDSSRRRTGGPKIFPVLLGRCRYGAGIGALLLQLRTH